MGGELSLLCGLKNVGRVEASVYRIQRDVTLLLRWTLPKGVSEKPARYEEIPAVDDDGLHGLAPGGTEWFEVTVAAPDTLGRRSYTAVVSVEYASELIEDRYRENGWKPSPTRLRLESKPIKVLIDGERIDHVADD